MKRVNKNAIDMVGGKNVEPRINMFANQKHSRKYSRKSKNAYSKSAGINSSKKFSIFVGVLISILCLATIAVTFMFFSDYFVLKRVKINGMIRSNSFDILSKAGLDQERNIFLISRKNIKNNIEQDPLLIVKSISLDPPDMISITVEERETIAILEYDKYWVEITKEGYIIKKDRIFNYNLPYLKGFYVDLEHTKIENDYTLYMINFLASLYESHPSIFNSISEIDASEADLVLYTRGYSTKVLLPHYITGKKMVDLAAILTLLKANGDDVVLIDFRFDNAVLKYR